ncbi:MAG TPA: transglycosylase SLT domain-containing protein [Bryobacteraceae bacterium]|nr:transglycosylase SLT domain-containing protein [Bryobacteraceae bacterium]
MKFDVPSLRRCIAVLALGSSGLLFAAFQYFTPQHPLPGIGAGRADITPEILRERTDRMIQSQTFTIMREPNATIGAERITGPRLAAIFRRAEAESGWPASLLAAIAYLESWGDPDATSPAGPRGIMQFSEATARAAGLRIVRVTRFKTTTSRQRVRRKSSRRYVYRTIRHRTPYTVTVRDDRLNPDRAAPAAARYLSRLESKFGGRDWAIFAYHCGEGCISDLLPLTAAAVHHPQPTVAEMFFAASPARNRELYEALQREMQRDYSPTYWFRVQRAEQLLDLYQDDPAAFRELVDDYQNPINPKRRAHDRLIVWLKSLDIFYHSKDDLRKASGKSLAKVLNDPEYYGFSLPEMGGADRGLYLQDSPSAIGTLLYVAFETHRLFDETKSKGEHFVPLQVAELVSTTDRPAEAGTLLVDPEFPEHSTGEVFDIDCSNLPRVERECFDFTLDDMGWDGYLGFIQVTGETVHIGSAPSSRDFFRQVFKEAAARDPE